MLVRKRTGGGLVRKQDALRGFAVSGILERIVGRTKMEYVLRRRKV